MRGSWRLILTLLLTAALLPACGVRRYYPLMAFRPTERPAQRLDLGAVALTPTGLVVAINEQDSSVIFEVSPYQDAAGRWRSIDPLGETFEELLQYADPGQGCPGEVGSLRWNACRSARYRAHVPMVPRAIAWLPGRDGRIVPPEAIQDLAPLPCPTDAPGCEARVVGVTEFSTIGRITEFREDTVPKSREQLERVFVLERHAGVWSEVRLPEIEVLRQRLSDWGRANCETDFVVEGLAFDPATETVFFGVNRCQGSAQKVLSYPLGAARGSAAVSLDVVADGIRNGSGERLAGPSEGLSSLDFAHGHLWATSSWDDYGHDHEPIYGGRLLVVDGGHLVEVPLAHALSDRSDALAVLPAANLPDAARTDDPRTLFPWVQALVLFDNDVRRRGARPNGTLVAASIPAPPAGGSIELARFARSPFGSAPLGLNGFDFEWYLRDHRLGYLGVIAAEQASGPGGWTSALGGLWQVRLGMIGRSTRWLPGKPYGHNRQAIAVTSYREAPELSFTGYRAVLSVVPGERTGDEVSIARVLEARREDYEVEATLPTPAAEGAGLVLQGFTIDTSPRASGGVCVSAVDLGVAWADPAVRDRVTLRGALLGGLCNDFNSREPEEFHGLTTDPDAGVRVTLYFAVVEGGEARSGSLVVAQRDRPGERAAATGVAFDLDRPPAPYASPEAPEDIENHPSKDNLACLVVDPAARTAELPPWPRRREAPPHDHVEWLADPSGALPSGPGTGRGGSLSGFAFALDLRGFDPGLYPDAYADVTELVARSQNVYVYRYLLRSWITGSRGVFLEGGISHGLHTGGLGKDNALPTALLVRSDLTWWEGLSAAPVAWDAAAHPWAALDPNRQPEDGYLRWATTTRLDGDPTCSPR